MVDKDSIINYEHIKKNEINKELSRLYNPQSKNLIQHIFHKDTMLLILEEGFHKDTDIQLLNSLIRQCIVKGRRLTRKEK